MTKWVDGIVFKHLGPVIYLIELHVVSSGSSILITSGPAGTPHTFGGEEGALSDDFESVAQEITTHTHTPEVRDESRNDLVADSQLPEVPPAPSSETTTSAVNCSPYPTRVRTAPDVINLDL